MTREERIQALFQDRDAAKDIFVEDVDQTLANLAAHGIEMNVEELSELTSGILAGLGVEEGEELSENALEDVAGGGIVSATALLIGLKHVGKAVTGGFTAGRQDKKNKTDNSVKYVESAKTPIGKGWRAIGVAIGYYL